MSRPFSPRSSFPSASFFRVNGKIRAREVRVVSNDGKQLGIISLGDALNLARTQGVDLVEIAATATPPVCRLVDYGKFRYEQAKKEKESKKHQHATTVKEIQLSPRIDPHDLGVKLSHAIDFLCEDMKVKIALKFRGREMAHTEFGFQVINKFLEAITPFGHPDYAPKLVGRGISVMITPLPRNKRGKKPHQEMENSAIAKNGSPAGTAKQNPPATTSPSKSKEHSKKPAATHPGDKSSGFANNPFSQLDAS